jgi:hypothetical protein
MRGGAQAHLVEGEDSLHYVVKFRNNPQHRRILINEWIASALLRHLQINGAETAVIELDAEFLAGHPDVGLQLGGKTIPAEPGWHLGSRYPGHPARVAVYDFLPDLLLEKVANVREYAGGLVFDQWAGNADSRQSVFYRTDVETPAGPRRAFVAVFIDHGFVFGGPEWAFHDSPRRGLYHRPEVYRSVSGWESFEPWLERVRTLPEQVLDAALRSLPASWLADDESELTQLLERLMRRRERVPALIEAVRSSEANPFPNWR